MDTVFCLGQGAVQLALRAAQTIDPENFAGQETDVPTSVRAKEQRRQCYTPLLQTLKSFLAPQSQAGQQPAASVTERLSCCRIFLRACASSQDTFFHKVLYSELVNLGASEQLLSLESPLLEQYLSEEGGLPLPTNDDGSGRAVETLGPLSARQVIHLQLLARFYINSKRCEYMSGRLKEKCP